MKKEQILSLFKKFESVAGMVDGVECWSSRELQVLLGYTKWENFEKVIEKAKESCRNSGGDDADHFLDVRKTIYMPKGGEKQVDDIMLTRYACYLIAQNGDSRKEEIAFAQNYFAVQTRKAELVEKRLLEYERVKAREKLNETEKMLSGILFERGIDNKGFALIRSKGDQALFKLTTKQLKQKLGISENRPVADFLPTICIKAKDLAAEMTSFNVHIKDLKEQQPIENEHIENNKGVRESLINRGIIPEKLPPAEDIKKLQRKLNRDGKQLLVQTRKIKKT